MSHTPLLIVTLFIVLVIFLILFAACKLDSDINSINVRIKTVPPEIDISIDFYHSSN